jgi:hypothetical protein
MGFFGCWYFLRYDRPKSASVTTQTLRQKLWVMSLFLLVRKKPCLGPPGRNLSYNSPLMVDYRIIGTREWDDLHKYFTRSYSLKGCEILGWDFWETRETEWFKCTHLLRHLLGQGMTETIKSSLFQYLHRLVTALQYMAGSRLGSLRHLRRTGEESHETSS